MTRPPQTPDSLILDTVLDVVFRTAVAFSLFLLFVGHNAPGGGFVGGLVAAAALVLRHVAGGTGRVDQVAGVHEYTLLGSGLATATATATYGLLANGSLLASSVFEADLPLLGHIKATTALPFDIGVYLVVVGLGLTLLRALGADNDPEDH